ncbi:MAG: Rnf-Nqr domain containing protein [Pseudohongiella sp.]|uniref:Rnf-Nqr domain containing protein n=1 Tax=Pseudohongiella sp. TaxID=1979412 RepID=UPI00349FE5B7
MNEFYVVLATIALINCVGLSRITGPASWFSPLHNPGVAMLFALNAAGLLVMTTLLSMSVLAVAAQFAGMTLPPWLSVALPAVTAGFLLLPVTALIRTHFTLQYRRLRLLLPVAALEATILASILLLASPDFLRWPTLAWVFGAAVGIVTSVVIFGGLRRHLNAPDVPGSWRGLPVELISAGILALIVLSPARGLAS